MRAFALLVAATAVLAGCSDASGDGGADDDRSSPSSGSISAAPTGFAPPPPPPPPEKGSCDLTVTQVTGPEGRLHSEGETCLVADALPADPAAAEVGLVEVIWSDLQQTIVDSIHARVESDACNTTCVVAEGTAAITPPIRLELNQTLLEANAAGLRVVVQAEGVMVDQPFTVHVSLFAVGPVPPGYSATDEA